MNISLFIRKVHLKVKNPQNCVKFLWKVKIKKIKKRPKKLHQIHKRLF